MVAPINPTQLTPPRVSLIDERSGAISREWYRFFLSLLTATQTNQEETELATNATSLLASYDAVFGEAIQGLESTPGAASASELAVVQSQTQASAVTPPCASTSDLAVVQSDVQALALSPRAELGTIASENKGVSGSFTAGVNTVTVTNGIITSIV
jgi:hypothetical protein